MLLFKGCSTSDLKQTLLQFLDFVSPVDDAADAKAWRDFLKSAGALTPKTPLVAGEQAGDIVSQARDALRALKGAEIPVALITLVLDIDNLYDDFQAQQHRQTPSRKSNKKNKQDFGKSFQEIKQAAADLTQSYSDSGYANIKRDLVVLKSDLTAQAKKQKALLTTRKARYDENLPTLKRKLQQHVASVADQQAQLKQLRQALKVTISRLSRGNTVGDEHHVLAEQLNAKVALRASLKRECSAEAAVRAQMQALRSGVVGAEKYADVYGARLPLEVGELNKKVDAVRRSQLGAQHGSQSAQGRSVSLQSVAPQPMAPVANVVPLPVAQPLWHQPSSPMIVSVATENPQNVVVRLPATEAYQAYEDGETDKALAWLKGNPRAINRHGGDGYTILFNAIESNDTAVVETLLNTSAFKPALEIIDEDNNRYNAIFEAWYADQAQATGGTKTLEAMLTDYAVANGQTDVVLNAMIDIYLESFRQSFAEEFDLKQETDRVAASELTPARFALVTQIQQAMKDIALAQTQRREDYVSDLENRTRTFEDIKAALAHNGKTKTDNITLLSALISENTARIDQFTALGRSLQSTDEAKP